MKISKFSILFLISISIFLSCEDENATEQLIPQENIKVKIPAFDANLAYDFIEKQVSFGPRVPNTEGHQKCKSWIISTVKGFGAEVIEQDFKAEAYTGTIFNGTNIIARFNPNVKERVLLAAHWDTRHVADHDPDTTKFNVPILGADDGGSGVGVLLSIAKTLKENPIPMGVDLIFFDAEDNGDVNSENPNSSDTWALGAQHWSKNPHVNRLNVKYGILLDMVGSKGATFPKEGYSVKLAGDLTNKVWNLANQMNKGNFFINENGAYITDDHVYVNHFAKIPMIDIINRKNINEFGDHWHTHNDNMDIIDKTTLSAVGQVVVAVVYKESNKEF